MLKKRHSSDVEEGEAEQGGGHSEADEEDEDAVYRTTAVGTNNVLLLYLNQETWVGEAGVELAKQVRCALLLRSLSRHHPHSHPEPSSP